MTHRKALLMAMNKVRMMPPEDFPMDAWKKLEAIFVLLDDLDWYRRQDGTPLIDEENT